MSKPTIFNDALCHCFLSNWLIYSFEIGTCLILSFCCFNRILWQKQLKGESFVLYTVLEYSSLRWDCQSSWSMSVYVCVCVTCVLRVQKQLCMMKWGQPHILSFSFHFVGDSASCSPQHTPDLPGILLSASHLSVGGLRLCICPALHGFWRFKLRSSYMQGKCFIHWATSRTLVKI